MRAEQTDSDAPPVTVPPWRPSPELTRSLAALLHQVAARRRRARLSHRPDPRGGPDLAVIAEEGTDKKEE